MTSSDEIKAALFAKLKTLCTLGEMGRDEIAVVTSAGEMDEFHSLTRKRDMSALVSEALGRIGHETYGLCIECQERISPKRLAAVPWAKYCMTCQEVKDGFVAEVRWNSAA